MKIVFLYTELAGYIKTCMDALANKGVEVHVFHYPVNPEAPFEFDLKNSPCRFYLRSEFSQAQLRNQIININPSVMVCSGWVDREYVNICRELKPKFKTIVAIDNQYEAGLKSWLSRLRARLFFKSAFNYAWVPGEPQVEYAKSMGFKLSEIEMGFYTIDIEKWNFATANDAEVFPKRFVFVGRYVEFKGIIELWQAYKQLESEEWELFCAGNGDLYAHRIIHKGIYHVGFVQPADLGKFASEGGVFVLPSHKEPWGVVVHEFAAAGFPIVCTTKVGAASAFVKEGKNGYIIKPNSTKELKRAMKKITEHADDELKEMGRVSKDLAKQINLDKWVETAFRFIKNKI